MGMVLGKEVGGSKSIGRNGLIKTTLFVGFGIEFGIGEITMVVADSS